jgi:uncharacterized protein (DUF111 family)
VVRIKVWDGTAAPRFKPEFDDVVRAADAMGIPALEVARRARLAAEALLQAGEPSQ